MDDLGDRMKMYEGRESKRKFLPMVPICVRIDGKNFSQFTKGLERPYDVRLSELMGIVVDTLVKETNACIGHTQSDEISLVYYSDNLKSQIFFDRKILKMVSVLTSVTTATFNAYLSKMIPEKAHRVALFDCRAWEVPTKQEAANVILWREFDATKNSISMAARVYYSHKQLHKKNGKDMQEMLFEKGVNWNDYPANFKRGMYFQKRTVLRKFDTKEIEKLPPKHEARENPDLEIERTEVRRLDMPVFSKVTNRVGVIFNGEDPIIEESN